MNFYEQKRVKRSIADLVEFIILKYEMIFGYDKNINGVYYYILGYISSKIDSDTAESLDESFHYNFNEWLYNKYRDRLERAMTWNRVYIELFINEDERLNAFYSDFIDFKNQVNNN
jgi:hypothetical protein